MPGKVVASRPIITDPEWRNGTADLALLARKVATWEQFTYCRDVFYAPQGMFDDDCANEPGVADGAAIESGKRLGTFYVPDPLSYARRLEVRVYSINVVGTVTITLTPSRGMAVTYNINANGWTSFTFPCAGENTVTVTMTKPGGTSCTVQSFCAWWEPLDGLRSDVSILNNPVFLQQGYFTSGRADSTYALQWLARAANRIAAHSPRMVVAHDFTWAGRTVPPSGGSAVIARYKVWIADFAAQLTLRIWGHSTVDGSCYVDVLANGSLIGSSAIPSNENSFTLGIATNGEVEIQIVGRNSGSDPTHGIGFWGVYIEQVNGGFSLPAGETVPASFPSIATDSIGGNQPIYADADASGARPGRRALVEGMIYLLARPRPLVFDWRGGNGKGGGDSAPAGSSVVTAAGATVGTVARLLLKVPVPCSFTARVIAGHLVSDPAGGATPDPYQVWLDTDAGVSVSTAALGDTSYQQSNATEPFDVYAFPEVSAPGAGNWGVNLRSGSHTGAATYYYAMFRGLSLEGRVPAPP